MDTAIKTLETSLAERNAAIRILQSKNSASLNMSVNNIDEILAARMGVATAGTPATPSHQGHQGHAHILAAAQAQAQQAQAAQAQEHQNILNIPILNSQHSSPHKKQFSMPSVLATPPQYHSLNLSKKLGHTQHRSLTPSADMFLGSQRQQAQHSATEYIRSATPSADILRAAPNTAEHMGQRATPSSSATNADIMRVAEILRATPTSELHRLSAPTDMIRGTPIEMLRGTPTHEIFRGGNHHQNTQNTAANMATANEMLRQHQQNIADHMMRATPTDHMMRATPTDHMMRATPTDHIMRGTPTDHLMRGTPTDHLMRGTPTGPPNLVPSGGLEPSHKRREPSGTSTGDSFQHPGPT